MSKRLANRVRAIARKRARTGHRPIYGEVEGVFASATDPWANVPDDQRRTVTQTLPGGIVLTTYTDTLEDLKRAPRGTPSAAPAETLPDPLPAPAAPSEPSPGRVSGWDRLDESEQEGSRP